MSGVDVRDLAKDNLPAGRFPASPRADFRLFLAPEVHCGTWEHAKKDLSVEICGVLVGRWERDENGPFAVVTDYVRCENASSKFAEVTFTHESWAQINREMDTRFADARIVGWYHSHPDFGIFLSDRDCFIQEHFFSSPGQVAYVIDPIRELEGVFAWHAGKPTPLAHFWIGDSIRTVAASRQLPGVKPGRLHGEPAAGELAGVASPSRRQASLDLAATLLAWIALFLLGYLVAGLKSQWEQSMIQQGAVYDYGFNKLMKIGLEEHLARVRLELSSLAVALSRLPETTADLSADEVQSVAKQRKLIANNLAVCEQELARIQERYGMSPVERDALFQLMRQMPAESRTPPETSADSGKTPNVGAPKSKPEDEPHNAASSVPADPNESPPADATTLTPSR